LGNALEWDFEGSPSFLLFGREVVRGTQQNMPVFQKPLTKFEALLDARSCFDAIRRGFLECYGADLKVFQECLERTIADFCPERRLDPNIIDLQHAVTAVRNLNPRDFGAEPDFFRQEIWPYYLAALENHSYWLSYDELLAVAFLAGIKLIVVQERDDGFHYRGDTLDVVSNRMHIEPIIVSIRGSGHRRIESHFERLLSKEQVDSINREVRREAETMPRELKAMKEEDALAKHRRQRDNQEFARDTAAMECADAESAAWRATQDAGMKNTGTAQESLEAMCEEYKCYEESFEEMYEKSRVQELMALDEAWQEEALYEQLYVEELAAQEEALYEQSRMEELAALATARQAEDNKLLEFQCDAIPRPADGRDFDNECLNVQDQGAKHEQWMSMFGIRVRSERERKPEPDLLLEVVEEIATSCLRDHVTMPADPENANISVHDASSGGRLPVVSCAFRHCTWCIHAHESSKAAYEDDPEHPWDQELRTHVLSEHSSTLTRITERILGEQEDIFSLWDLYKEALSVQERLHVPITGPSVERRTTELAAHVYNDACIRALICFTCARVKVDTGRLRSEISMKPGKWLFSLPAGSLVKNFSMTNFVQRYWKEGTPMVLHENSAIDAVGPDFTDWKLSLHPEYLKLLDQDSIPLKSISATDLEKLASDELLCCPEDQACEHGCKQQGRLCSRCRIPLCRECQLGLQRNEIIPHGLINDNWYGYIQQWVYRVGVTWMEKTVSSPFWTGLTLFNIGRRDAERKSHRQHLMHDTMYSSHRRVAFKGQVFSAPMNWSSLVEQLKRLKRRRRASSCLCPANFS